MGPLLLSKLDTSEPLLHNITFAQLEALESIEAGRETDGGMLCMLHIYNTEIIETKKLRHGRHASVGQEQGPPTGSSCLVWIRQGPRPSTSYTGAPFLGTCPARVAFSW